MAAGCGLDDILDRASCAQEGGVCVLCPHCGPAGRMEQVEFSSDYEIFYCLVCQNRYIAYALGRGEFTEPVLVPPPAPDAKLGK